MLLPNLNVNSSDEWKNINKKKSHTEQRDLNVVGNFKDDGPDYKRT